MTRILVPLLGTLLWAACQKPKPPVQPTSLVTYEKNGRYGFRDVRGTVIIPAQYLSAYDFSPEGVAFVADDDGWACINQKGEALLNPYLFDNGPDYLSEGLFRYVKGGKVGFADVACQVTIPASYDFASPFQEGLAAVCTGCVEVPEPDGEHSTIQGGTWGYIDKKGTVVIPLQYQAAEPFEGGKAKVTQGTQVITIDTTGKVTTP